MFAHLKNLLPKMTIFINISSSFSNRFLPWNSLSIKQPILQYRSVYSMAKISKKDEQKKQKKKGKEQARESLGGDLSFVDLDKYQQSYENVLASFREQIEKVRIGRLEPSIFSNIYVKVEGHNFTVAALGQVSSKTMNSCVISPYDSDNIEVIQKSLKVYDENFQIKRSDKSLIVNQSNNSVKDVKQKAIAKIKKIANDKKQDMKRVRAKNQEQIKKYKTIIPEDRYRQIESELKKIFQTKNEQLQKGQRQKEKELLK